MDIKQEAETMEIHIEDISPVLTAIDVMATRDVLHLDKTIENSDPRDFSEDGVLMGALYTQECDGFATILNQLNTFANLCPYNRMGMFENYNTRKSVIFSSENADWGLVIGNSMWPLWIQDIFVSYMEQFKQITLRRSPYFAIQTVEQMEAWLDKGILLDYTSDILFGNINISLVEKDIKHFESKKYGFSLTGISELPVFFKIVKVHEDTMTLMPITPLGVYVLPAMFTIKKTDLTQQVVGGALDLWTLINNPHMESVLKEFTKFTNQYDIRGE